MTGNLCLNVAERRVREFADEADALLASHSEAMECWKCQELLQKGIDAYRWLTQADAFLREADYQGVFDFSPELQDAVNTLYQAWLQPCEFAERRIVALLERGYQLDNLQEFREICEQVEEIIDNREWRKAAAQARILASSEDTDE